MHRARAHPSRRAVPVLLLVAAVGGGCGGDTAEGGAGEPPAGPARAAEPAPLPAGAEAVSFLGEALEPPMIPEERLEVYRARYAEAEEALASAPEDVDALIWMGRRTAYLGQYRAAIDIYTHALGLHPDDARLYRHRGHRYVTVRELDRAVADFRRAAELTDGTPDEVEPDGLPNALGIPTSTLHFNIWYHLGLAYYLAGDFAAAAEAYARCAEVSVHPDSQVATAYWRVLTLLRTGRDAEARAVLDGIEEDMEVIESTGYLDLLLLFKGERSAEELLGPAGDEATLASTTTAYGVGMWHLLQGDAAEAERIFRLVLSGRAAQWAAFGYIAAEAEVAGLGRREG